MNGIVAYGSYIPYYRLDRKAIGETLGASAGSGTRSVACYDEDTTSMAVEAARAALRGASGVAPAAVYFATANPAYLDKTNATAIHAALDLEPGAAAFDMLGSVRSGMGALRAALDAGRPTLAVAVRRAHRAARRGRRARRRRRRGGLPLRARRGRRARARDADRVGVGDGGVPRALAGARRPGLAPVGGALRRARVRAAGRGGPDRGAEAGRRHGGRDRPPRRRRPPRARGQARRGRGGHAQGQRRRRPHRDDRQYRAPRTPGSSSPTRSTAPRPISSSRWSRSPTARTR